MMKMKQRIWDCEGDVARRDDGFEGNWIQSHFFVLPERGGKALYGEMEECDAFIGTLLFGKFEFLKLQFGYRLF